MDRYYNWPLSKALLTSLFAGIIASLACLIFNVVFRESTMFPLSDIINVSSIIFIVNLIFVVIGFIYHAFRQLFKKADLFYIVFFVLLTIFLAWRSEGIHRSDNPIYNIEFIQLLLVMIIILGVCAAFMIPYLYHNKSFERNVL